jgi:hypothetical protein
MGTDTHDWPTTSPRLRRVVPDAYVATLGGGKTAYTMRVERDGAEWIRTDLSRPGPWYPSVAAFRRSVADSNVTRWCHQVDPATRKTLPEANRFRRWAVAEVGGPACTGVRTNLAAGLGFQVHDGCCNNVVGRPLPDGVTILDLYERWTEAGRP